MSIQRRSLLPLLIVLAMLLPISGRGVTEENVWTKAGDIWLIGRRGNTTSVPWDHGDLKKSEGVFEWHRPSNLYRIYSADFTFRTFLYKPATRYNQQTMTPRDKGIWEYVENNTGQLGTVIKTKTKSVYMGGVWRDYSTHQSNKTSTTYLMTP